MTQKCDTKPMPYVTWVRGAMKRTPCVCYTKTIRPGTEHLPEGEAQISCHTHEPGLLGQPRPQWSCSTKLGEPDGYSGEACVVLCTGIAGELAGQRCQPSVRKERVSSKWAKTVVQAEVLLYRLAQWPFLPL